MRVRKLVAVAVMVAVAVSAGGCEQLNEVKVQLGLSDTAWVPSGADAVAVHADGTITETISETLDESYYSSSELEQMILESVSSYNTQYGADSVAVEEYLVDGKAVSLTLSFASAEDFAGFNNVEFYCGTIIGAQLEGYLFDVSFYPVSDGVMSYASCDYTKVFSDMSAQVIICTAPLQVHVPTNVTFISTNAEMEDATTVNATGEEEESVSLELPSSAVYEGEEVSYAEQKVANRIYIIYE